ncbi:YhhN-like protein [compost metagenome]
MVGSAIGSGSLIATAGALLFMASDAMIAFNRFVAPFAAARVAIIVTYHLGQFLLVYALRG